MATEEASREAVRAEEHGQVPRHQAAGGEEAAEEQEAVRLRSFTDYVVCECDGHTDTIDDIMPSLGRQQQQQQQQQQ